MRDVSKLKVTDAPREPRVEARRRPIGLTGTLTETLTTINVLIAQTAETARARGGLGNKLGVLGDKALTWVP